MRERAKSLRYEKYDLGFILGHGLTRDYRIIAKLGEEGWAEELENHPSTYAGLKYLSGIRIVRPLTDKSTSFVG